MGARFVLEGLSQLRQGGEAFARNREASRQAGERQDAIDAKNDRETARRERLQGVDDARTSVIDQVSSNPDFTREQALKGLDPLLSASTELGDPNIAGATSRTINEIFDARDAASALKSREDIAAGKVSDKRAKESKAEAKKRKKEEEDKSLKGRMKALSGENRKRFDSTRMGLNAADELRAAIGGGVARFSLLGDNDFTRARRRWGEALGRVQSGGAITKDEIPVFLEMAPTKFDSAEQVEKKLDDIELLMAGRLESMGFGVGEIRDFRKGVASKAKAGRAKPKTKVEVDRAENPDRGSVRVVDESVFDKFINTNRQIFDERMNRVNAERQARGVAPYTEAEQQQIILELAKRKAGITPDLSE